MYPIIWHIYGPFALHSFSVAIAIGLYFFVYLTTNHAHVVRFIDKNTFMSLIVECALAGIMGGRLLHVISEWHLYPRIIDMLRIWDGGLSIFGTLLAVIAYGSYFLYRNQIAIMSIADIAALYAPLLHAFGRVGCLLAGCCYGRATDMPWALPHIDHITGTLARVHPTQIYSACMFIVLFLVLRSFSQARHAKQGQIAMLYLIGASTERFVLDFFRGDRIEVHALSTPILQLSFNQLIAIVLLAGATLGLYIITHATASKQADESL